ncbi:putative protein serine/threonine kinase [Heterostelium album PN500]|uniref:non-specific serine/threonine protein kinase n=1 Tax=Heterostelium pallidum (strain ATCC 26659 / Pp 5 / PN500) TaxID=670386 RepID=D3B6H5_HETP5|nr:putative protein serine/threonine kinase [Heterostelium album PN500]EFA82945.1 putative protein serine/threonine kinase [Heterostelium album PN500]|eukprot:XP_020435062.1 putative protein serine/threonine kinase [Heterostelium album PN500]
MNSNSDINNSDCLFPIRDEIIEDKDDDDDEIPPTQFTVSSDAMTSTDNDNLQHDQINHTETGKEQDEEEDEKIKIWGELLAVSDKLSSVTLSDDSFVLGRLKTCNITIPETIISAKHCRLFKSSNDCILIQDLSTNGTFINGKMIGRGNLEVVKNGDRISLAGASVENQLTYIFKDNKLEPKSHIWETLSTKKILNDYDIIGELGGGSFSVVYLAVNKSTATKVAIKDIDISKYNQNPRYLTQLDREIEILRSIKHPNIINIHEIFQSDNHIYIVMELATGGELYEKLENEVFLGEEVARLIFLQLLNAVDYLHSQGIAHRDLKPENILFDGDDKIKITDFGFARVIGDGELAKTLCGTPLYVAPEVIVSRTKLSTNTNFSNGYGFTCDAWSLGAILYILLSGDAPFCDDTQEESISTPTIFESIVAGDISYPEVLWADISADGIDLVKRLLTVEPTERITIKEALKHPWLLIEPSKEDDNECVSDPEIREKRPMNHQDQDDSIDNSLKRRRTFIRYFQ